MWKKLFSNRRRIFIILVAISALIIASQFILGLKDATPVSSGGGPPILVTSTGSGLSDPGAANIKADIARKLAEGKKPNRLIKEKSPYLLQHAFNPVDWYP